MAKLRWFRPILARKTQRIAENLKHYLAEELKENTLDVEPQAGQMDDSAEILISASGLYKREFGSWRQHDQGQISRLLHQFKQEYKGRS